MALSKLEIQQMLREMNVKFQADETYDQLKQRLQQAHHRLWLQSLSGPRSTTDGADKRLIKKRRQRSSSVDPPPVVSAAPDHPQPWPPNAPGGSRRPDRTYRHRSIEKPEPGQPWKAAAAGTEPFNRKKKVFVSVLKRAKGCCELCGRPFLDGPADEEPAPFYIDPLEQGGEHSVKNVVALCKACWRSMQTEPAPKDIKALKRRARAKLYDELAVVHRKSGPRRKGTPRKPPR